MVIVKAIKEEKVIHGCAWILQKIVDMLKQEWQVELSHGRRESNRCADLLANIEQESYKSSTKTDHFKC